MLALGKKFEDQYWGIPPQLFTQLSQDPKKMHIQNNQKRSSI
jgi:hypothetical protein